MHYSLEVYDVSSMLYAGQFSSKYSSRQDMIGGTITSNGIPCGGIRYVLQSVIDAVARGTDTVLVFDSPTDKNTLFKGYKGTRIKHTEIYIQQQMLLDAVKAIGIPYLKVANYEADDLIASVMQKYTGNHMKCNMYSGDTDLAANIINERVTLIGTASIYPTITKDNYDTTVKKNTVIPFNSVLPYYAIFGKQSNNVPALAEHSKCQELFRRFWEYSESSRTSPAYYSTAGHFAQWLLHELELKDEPEELIAQLYDRIAYVFPRLIETLPDIPFVEMKDLDKKNLAFFLDMFNLEYLRNNCNILSLPTTVGSQEAIKYLQHYKADYASGVLGADSNTIDQELYFSSDNKDTTTYFTEGDAF